MRYTIARRSTSRGPRIAPTMTRYMSAVLKKLPKTTSTLVPTTSAPGVDTTIHTRNAPMYFVGPASMSSSQIKIDQFAAENVPAVQSCNRLATAVAQSPAQCRVVEHGPDRGRKVLRIITNEDVLAVDGLEPLAAKRGRHDWLPHRP